MRNILIYEYRLIYAMPPPMCNWFLCGQPMKLGDGNKPRSVEEALRRMVGGNREKLNFDSNDISQGFAELMSEEWEEQLAPLMDQIRAAAASASDFPSFLAGLDGVTSDSALMTEHLAAATFVSRIMAADG